MKFSINFNVSLLTSEEETCQVLETVKQLGFKRTAKMLEQKQAEEQQASASVSQATVNKPDTGVVESVYNQLLHKILNAKSYEELCFEFANAELMLDSDKMSALNDQQQNELLLIYQDITSNLNSIKKLEEIVDGKDVYRLTIGEINCAYGYIKNLSSAIIKNRYANICKVAEALGM